MQFINQVDKTQNFWLCNYDEKFKIFIHFSAIEW